MKKFLILLFIFALAFSIRFAYLSANQRQIESDECLYDSLAIKLIELKGYVGSEGVPTSNRPPLYAVFLALVYTICGHDYFAVCLVQAFLGSLAVCFFYLIAEKIFNEPTAILTGIFSSFYMGYVFYTNFLLTETFFSFILAAIILIIVNIKQSNVIRFSLLGLLCGLLTLTKSSGFFVFLIAPVALWVKTKREKDFLKKIFSSSLALLLCFGLVILSWTVRNYKVHGKIIPISTNGGLNMYQAVRPAYGKIPEMGPRGDSIAEKGFVISNETERNDYFFNMALQAYREDGLARILKSFIIRFLFFWGAIDWNVTEGDIINYHYVFILPFALLGTIFSFKNRKEIFVILLVILYFTSLILLFQGCARFRMPIDGYIIILGCYGIYELINRQREKIYLVALVGIYFFFTYMLYRHSLYIKYFIKSVMEKIGLW
ncbi:MAG: glycosyltransferase family 39 protein [Candidatus Omnitrophota bacterium]|nr:MAG: glycosyltransferase family 39 protein [Candidatus Omnitrophota bacterium]